MNQDGQNTELDKVLARLSMDQIRFVTARLESRTDKEAAKKLNMQPNTIKKWKQNGAPIDEACRLMAMDGLVTAQHILTRNVIKAACVKVKGLESDDERIQQNVSSEVLDRILGRPTQKQEITGKDGGAITIKNTGNLNTDEL